MPDALRPPLPVTNAALLGTLVDAGFGWPNDISVHSGRLAEGGDVCGWVDTGITPVSRVATAYAGGPEPAVWEWYWPSRLSVDLDVADAYGLHRVTMRAKLLCLRHYAGPDLARRANALWRVLSTGCKYHHDEMGPSHAQVRAWLTAVQALVMELAAPGT